MPCQTLLWLLRATACRRLPLYLRFGLIQRTLAQSSSTRRSGSYLWTGV